MITLIYNSDDTLDFYIDGAVIATDIAFSDTFQCGVNYVIGGGSGELFEGDIDEVGIWNRTLTSNEISILWNDGNALGYGDQGDNQPVVTLNSPSDNYNTTSQTFTFNCTASDDSNLTSVSLYIDGSLNQTNSSGLNNSDYIFTKTLIDGDHNWTCSAVDNKTQTTIATTRYFIIDNTDPVINILYPIDSAIYETDYTNSTNISIDLNWSTSDTHLDDCWYNNGTANVTVVCGNNATINLPWGEYTFIIYANDTFGNNVQEEVTARWRYILYQENISYNSDTLTGNSEAFSIDVTYNETLFPNSLAYLYYDGTAYSTTKTGSSGDYVFSKTLAIPDYTSQKNNTFYFNFILNNGTNNYYNSSQYNQTVNVLQIDNCSSYSHNLYNFTILDEKNQNHLNETYYNLSVELNIILYNLDGNQIQNYSTSYGEINPIRLCLNDNLASGESYNLDLQLKYDADDYASEFYHKQQERINSSDFNTSINLYDLDETNSQEFKISYKDASLLPISNVLIQIQRKYVSEGIFKTVEIPKTDSNGETIGHFELSDAIYNILVVQEGTILATFNNIIAYCDNVATGDCTIDLSETLSHVAPGDYTMLDDFSFTKSWDLSNRLFVLNYTIPTGEARDVQLNGYLIDGLGNTSVCTDSLTSSSGTLTCTIPNSFGNSSVTIKVYDAGTQKAEVVISLWESPATIYGASMVFISLVLLLTIVGMGASSQPVITGFFIILGIITSIALNLVSSSGYWGAGATVLWIIIAIIIVLIKSVNRN